MRTASLMSQLLLAVAVMGWLTRGIVARILDLRALDARQRFVGDDTAEPHRYRETATGAAEPPPEPRNRHRSR